MDPGKIISSRLRMEKIREAAEDFRSAHIFSDSLPIDIENVIEATMGINIIPIESLQKDCDMDGFISTDFKNIYVDKDLYIDDRYYRRVRFTIAHELGHLILHRSSIDGLNLKSESEWIRFRKGINDETLGWFETQASEFAGRLLVPVDQLYDIFILIRKENLKKYSSWGASEINDDELFSIVAPKICNKFDVSAEVIEKRLRKENIMSLLGK